MGVEQIWKQMEMERESKGEEGERGHEVCRFDGVRKE